MSLESSPRAAAATGGALLTTIAVAAIVACIVLVIVILPAEYNVDPTGIGAKLGLTEMNKPAAGRTLEIRDVSGGNERLREVMIPDAGTPTPLPNPGVFQNQPTVPQTRSVTVNLPALGKTEVKTVLDEAKVIVFSWEVAGGAKVLSDFHGHNPDLGSGFVRYREDEQASSGSGSLVAPFAGEHGWFWLNTNTEPVSITLNVTGYFNDIKTYGL